VKSHFLPYWPDNPYQPLLKDGLLAAGVAVQAPGKLAELSKSASNGDLAHLHWLPPTGLGPRRLLNTFQFLRQLTALRRKGIPIVWTAHNVIPHESRQPRIDLWLSGKVTRMADRIICHSESARDEIVAQLKLTDPSKIRVIPHGHYVDSYPNSLSRAECRQRLSVESDDLVFLFLGRIRAYKGVFTLLESFQRHPAHKAKLIIAGKPHDQAVDAEVRGRIKGDERVIYRPGFMADADIQLYLNAADAVVFPYQKSLTSGALILAMSFGRACIAPRLPGTVDCLTEDGGILYDATRPEGLSEALAAANSQRDQLGRMGAKNLERARSWDWPSIAKATAACYEEARQNAQRRASKDA
jgi:beta-1,4-mannosyltransferase